MHKHRHEHEAAKPARMVAAFATPDGRRVDFHAWTEDGDGSLRDGNHATEIADYLAGLSERVIHAEPVGSRLLFEAWIEVRGTRRGTPERYTCDYRRHDGCPLNVIDAGMDVYREFKRAIRRAREEVKAS